MVNDGPGRQPAVETQQGAVCGFTETPPPRRDGMNEVRRLLFTSVIGDILDVMGRHHQFLPPAIRPVRPGFMLVGRAMPVLIADVFPPVEHPFGLLTQALDSLGPDDVYLAHGGRAECAAFGEIMTDVARRNGAAGAVIDGYHRDHARVLTQQWPVFSHGAYGQDAGARASVVDFGVPVEIGSTAIAPGDLILGDDDGVVCIPRVVEDEVLERAFEKVRAENRVLDDIRGGSSATDAFERHGVL